MKPVAILIAAQRSGTHLIRSILETDSRVHCLPEVFNDNFGARNEMFPELPYFLEVYEDSVRRDPARCHPSWRKELVTDYFERIEQLASAREQSVIVDVKNSSLHLADGVWRSPSRKPEMLKIFEEKKYPIIYLQRENFINLAFSSFRARNTGEYVISSDDHQEKGSFELPLKKFIKTVRQLEWNHWLLRTWLRKNTGLLINISYENLFDIDSGNRLREEPFTQIAEHLEIESPQFDLVPKIQKVAPKRIRDEIKNFDALAEALAGSRYETMLDT